MYGDSVPDKIISWFMDNVMPWFLMACFAAFFVALPILFIIDCNRETFSLTKDDWACVEHRQVRRTRNVLVGKMIMPQTTTSSECVNWMRKN